MAVQPGGALPGLDAVKQGVAGTPQELAGCGVDAYTGRSTKGAGGSFTGGACSKPDSVPRHGPGRGGGRPARLGHVALVARWE